MQALQATVKEYAQRLKNLEDFISFQFGEAYQQFRTQKSEDEEETEEDEPLVDQTSFRKKSNKPVTVTITKISNTKAEIISPKPEVASDDEGGTSTSYYARQASSSVLYDRKNSQISEQLRCLVPESLEVDFVSDPDLAPDADDPLDVQQGFWNNNDNDDEMGVVEDDQDDGGVDIDNSELYEIYEDEDDFETGPQITGPALNCIEGVATSSMPYSQAGNRNGNSMQARYNAPQQECFFCDNRYDSRNTMFQHILDDHTGGESYCPICQKSYTYQKDFRCHLSRHDKRNRIRFKCSYCVKYFGSRKELNNHERVHTGEKPYSCATCLREFRTSSSLIRHQKCHGPYVCMIGDCKLRYQSNKELQLHQSQTVHIQIN